MCVHCFDERQLVWTIMFKYLLFRSSKRDEIYFGVKIGVNDVTESNGVGLKIQKIKGLEIRALKC